MTISESFITPYGPSNSTCGYCSPSGERSVSRSSYCLAALDAQLLSCKVYQDMVDRGWRRSGTYCYKPDLKRSCCPHYSIKLDALQFKPSRSQRQIINRWNRFVKGVQHAQDAREIPKTKSEPAPTSLSLDTLSAAEYGFVQEENPAHEYTVTLEPSSYTVEKFDLYRRYQTAIHNDYDCTPKGFKRFLVNTPLTETSIPYPTTKPRQLPATYGSYHQMYRLDGKLIAIGVVDILPKCVSSVYFIYNPELQKHSLGKLSALREILLAQEIHEAGVPDMTSLYMGYYIHSCQKMRYKGEYSPSCLLDPEQYTWFPFETCVPLLRNFHYACFSDPTHSLKKPSESAQEALVEGVPEDVVGRVRAVSDFDGTRVLVQPLCTTEMWTIPGNRQLLMNFASAFGADALKETVFNFSFC